MAHHPFSHHSSPALEIICSAGKSLFWNKFTPCFPPSRNSFSLFLVFLDFKANWECFDNVEGFHLTWIQKTQQQKPAVLLISGNLDKKHNVPWSTQILANQLQIQWSNYKVIYWEHSGKHWKMLITDQIKHIWLSCFQLWFLLKMGE